MHQLNLLIQQTGVYVVLSIHGKAHSTQVHKQIMIPLKISENLIMSFKTIKLFSHTTM